MLACDHHRRVKCGSTGNLQVHQNRAHRHHGPDQVNNPQTLCDRCHVQAPGWGRRTARVASNPEEPDQGKLSCPVRWRGERPRPQNRKVGPAPVLRSSGFLLAAHDYLTEHTTLIVSSVITCGTARSTAGRSSMAARLCMINLYLHGIGANGGTSPIRVADSLAADPARPLRSGADQPALRQEVQRHLRQRRR